MNEQPFRDLEEACREASTENWDGYGAQPVQPKARRHAEKLLKALAKFPSPEISVDPDGEIGLDWENEHGLYLVSVDSRGGLSYAGFIGGKSVNGKISADEVAKDLALIFPNVA